jgi:type II secretory pathway predicted ATPase ExeA
MALTDAQLLNIEYETALERARFAARDQDKSGIKLESVRVAQTTLMENLRNTSVAAAEPITATDIIAFADSLRAYIHSDD